MNRFQTAFILSHKRWVDLILALSVVALGFELGWILPSVLVRWQPFDYNLYIEMGQAVRAGVDPYGVHHYWTFPTMLWIFVPLSFMPDWFRLVWILGPFISALVLLRKQGMLLFFFVPLWFVVGDGMIDGWLLLPLAMLLANSPGWAGLGAAIVLFKPQMAFLAVGYAFLRWLVERDWKNLGVFVGMMTIFYVPAFIIDPNWVFEMLEVLPGRAEQTTTLFPLIGGSIWSWWALGGFGIMICLVLLASSLILGTRMLKLSTKRAAVFLLLGLALDPILFGSNQIMALPTLSRRIELMTIILISWGAFALDNTLGGFGGGYALIPLTALYFSACQSEASPTKAAP